MRRHMSRQRETWGVILVALVAVILYAAWGAAILNHKVSEAEAQGAIVANR